MGAAWFGCDDGAPSSGPNPAQPVSWAPLVVSYGKNANLVRALNGRYQTLPDLPLWVFFRCPV